MYQHLPPLMMPRSFSSLHCSLRPHSPSDFSNISRITGDVAGSASREGRSFAPSLPLISL